MAVRHMVMLVTEVKPCWLGYYSDGWPSESESGVNVVGFFLGFFFRFYSCTLRNHVTLESPNSAVSWSVTVPLSTPAQSKSSHFHFTITVKFFSEILLCVKFIYSWINKDHKRMNFCCPLVKLYCLSSKQPSDTLI